MGRRRLLDPALIHHHHEVGDGDRLQLRVGDVDERDPELPLHPAQFPPHLQAQELVQGGQGLVEQQDARLGDQRARQRDPLLLAAGQLGRHPLREPAVQLHLGEHLAGPLVAFRPPDASHL